MLRRLASCSLVTEQRHVRGRRQARARQLAYQLLVGALHRRAHPCRLGEQRGRSRGLFKTVIRTPEFAFFVVSVFFAVSPPALTPRRGCSPELR